jgi:hypothetical protein
MVNAPKKNLSPLQAGNSEKWTKHSTQPSHQANKGNRGLEVKRDRMLGELHSLWFNTKLVAEKRGESHCLSSEEREKWTNDYVEQETAAARTPVQDTVVWWRVFK